MKEHYGKILFNQNEFKKNFTNEFLEKLSLKMKELILGPGEVIYLKNDLDTRLFFVKKGEIEFFEECSLKVWNFGTAKVLFTSIS